MPLSDEDREAAFVVFKTSDFSAGSLSPDELDECRTYFTKYYLIFMRAYEAGMQAAYEKAAHVCDEVCKDSMHAGDAADVIRALAKGEK